jgi:hypothetical protein
LVIWACRPKCHRRASRDRRRRWPATWSSTLDQAVPPGRSDRCGLTALRRSITTAELGTHKHAGAQFLGPYELLYEDNFAPVIGTHYLVLA